MHYLEDSDPQEDDLVGRVLCGKWTVRERIGRGGMSIVYAATHRNGRKVAVKVLRRALASNRRIVERFLREGYVANKIRHPGAVAVLDDDVDGDTVFLVMEFLDGATLAERYGKGAPTSTLGEVLGIGEQLLDVLAAAHASGVVHRDIKPSNVFVTRDGEVMLLDFGIARLLESEAEASATHSGATLGTPGFMAPEQARGRANLVDARTDVWAVGALLFFLFTGRTVHEAETPNELLIASATQPARSVGALCTGLPEPIVALVDRALAMDRDLRWPDAHTMKDALAGARGDISDIDLTRPVERAVGVAGTTTLPETNTAEPAVVSRKERLGSAPTSHAAPGALRKRRVAWALVLGVVFVAAGAALRLRGPVASTRSADSRAAPQPAAPRAATAAPASSSAEPAPREATVGRNERTPAPNVRPMPDSSASPIRPSRRLSPSSERAATPKARAEPEPVAETTPAAPSADVDVLDLRR